MLARLAARAPLRMPAQVRAASTSNTGGLAYNVVFKRNSSYFTFIVVGAVIIEGVFGAGMSTLWSGLNSGRMYKNTDWSKFKVEDEE